MTDWRTRPARIERMAGARGPEREQLVEDLVEAVRTRSGDLDALNTAVEALRRIGATVVPRLLPLLETDLPAETRIAASLALGQLGSGRAAGPLLDLLDDADPNVRYHAIEALGRLRAETAVPRLAGLLKGDDLFLVFPALIALKSIGQPCALPELMACLENEMLVEDALEAIGACACAAVLPELVRLLLLGRLPWNQTLACCEAIISAGRASDAGAYGAEVILASRLNLRGFLDELPATNFSAAARLCLCRILAWQASQASSLEDVESALERILVLSAGISMVGLRFPLHRLSERALRLIARASTEERKIALIGLAGECPGEAPASLLLGMARDTDPSVRKAAAEALSEHPGPLELDALLPFAAAADPDVASAARAVAGRQRPDGLTEERLLELLAHPDPACRALVAHAARNLPLQSESGSAGVRLLEMLNAEDEPPVRTALLESALRRGEPAASWLEGHWGSLGPSETAVIAANLDRLAVANVLSWLARCLDATDIWTRLQAARFCALNVETARALDPLRQQAMRADPLPPLRAVGLRLLSAAEGAFLTALSDPEPEVRRAALSGLSTCSSESSLRALVELYETAEPDERETLLDSLKQGPAARALVGRLLRAPAIETSLGLPLARLDPQAYMGAALQHEQRDWLVPPFLSEDDRSPLLEALLRATWPEDPVRQALWLQSAAALRAPEEAILERLCSAWAERARLLALFELGLSGQVRRLAETLKENPDNGLSALATLLLESQGSHSR